MKKIILFSSFVVIAFTVNSQLKIDNATFFISPGATVTVQGDLTSNVNIQGTGVLVLKGSASQNVNMGGFAVPNLELDNSSGANLTGNLMVSNSLVLTNGRLQLNASDLQIGVGITSITGASSNKFIITNGLGKLIKTGLGATAFNFPVGFSNTEFNPLTISNSGTIDAVGVRCLQNVLDQGLNGSAVTENFANNSWAVTETVAGGSNLELSAEWVGADELPGFNRVKSGIARYNSGTDWDLPASNVVAAAGSGPYSRTRNNVTSTGVFAIADLDRVNAARLNLKVFLQGAYNSENGLMNDLLRDNPSTGGLDPIIPTDQPYSSALASRFSRVGVFDGSTSVNESINPAVLAITGSNAIVDWVYVATLDPNNPASKLQTRAALLQRDGDIVDIDGISPLSMPIDADGNFHFLVSHRNHFSIRSATSMLLAKNTVLSHNFSTSLGQAYSNPGITINAAMVQNGSVFLMWAGDANSDSYIRVTSLTFPDITSETAYILPTFLGGNLNGTLTGYSIGDVNMDRIVRVTSQTFPQLKSETEFLLSIVLNGDINGTRREHK
jgi:hypothetical protein